MLTICMINLDTIWHTIFNTYDKGECIYFCASMKLSLEIKYNPKTSTTFIFIICLDECDYYTPDGDVI